MDGAGVPVKVFVDTDGTVTFSDLPPELEEVARLLDPSLGVEAEEPEKQKEVG